MLNFTFWNLLPSAVAQSLPGSRSVLPKIKQKLYLYQKNMNNCFPNQDCPKSQWKYNKKDCARFWYGNQICHLAKINISLYFFSILATGTQVLCLDLWMGEWDPSLVPGLMDEWMGPKSCTWTCGWANGTSPAPACPPCAWACPFCPPLSWRTGPSCASSSSPSCPRSGCGYAPPYDSEKNITYILTIDSDLRAHYIFTTRFAASL